MIAISVLTIDLKVQLADTFHSEKGKFNSEMPKICKQWF